MSKWRPQDNGCLYVFPDIHGNVSLLEKALVRILPLRNTKNAVDKIIFLGDYVDRHVDSAAVIDLLISLKEIYKDQIICIKGNHEDLFLKSLGIDCSDLIQNLNCKTWKSNGGIQTISSYIKRAGLKDNPYNFKITQLKEIIPNSHIEFLNSCLDYYQEDEYVFVHGGYEPAYPMEQYLEKYSVFNLYWDGSDRNLFNYVKSILFLKGKLHWNHVVVCGHSGPIPIFHPNYRMIDAGAPRQLLLYEAKSNQAMVSVPKNKKLQTYVTDWTVLEP